MSLRPKDLNDSRFFFKYVDGKCHRSFMGIHTIGEVPKKVALYLQLPNWKEYTGHSLRRTSATLLVDSGADVITLKRHGGWKSSSVAEGYYEESMCSKQKVARRILDVSEEASDSTHSNNINFRLCNNTNINEAVTSSSENSLSGTHFQNATFNNCIFNFNR